MALPPVKALPLSLGLQHATSRRSALLAVFVAAALASCAAVTVPDTTPPTLVISGVHPFLFHILVTVQLSEDGMVYCGAKKNAGSGTTTPSVYEMTTGSDLDGYGNATVLASAYKQIVVAGLAPSTAYDLYCYATDGWLNGIDIASTKRSKVTTASGGDYTAPTFWYISPFTMVDSNQVRVYFRMSEDGTVWCGALHDAGGGTAPPSSLDLVSHTAGVFDSWGTVLVRAATNYSSEIWLLGLEENTTYDVYCFARDRSGNGIDLTPALPPLTGAINATKVSVKTLGTYVPTRFRLVTKTGTTTYEAEPAVWNVELPRTVVSGGRVVRNLESLHAPLVLRAARLVDLATYNGSVVGQQDLSSGCYGLPPAPRFGGPFVALLRRGRCTFQAKATRALNAGYQAIVVIDSGHVGPNVTLAGMTAAGGSSAAIEIPGWLVSSTAGQGLVTALATLGPGLVSVEIEDRRRKPPLGPGQRDDFGVRFNAVI